MGYDSVTTWRLYSAEQSVPLGVRLDDEAAARTFVKKVTSSSWWRDNVADKPRIELRVAGAESPDGWRWSYAKPSAAAQPTKWQVSIHPAMLNDMVVLHELAHCAAPRWSLSKRRWRPGRLCAHEELPPHGSGFAGVFAALVDEFGEGAAAGDLRDAYAHYRVPSLTLSEYQQAVRDSLTAEADVLSSRAEWEEMSAQFDAELEAAGVAKPLRVPQVVWGDWLLMARIRGRRVGMDRLAAAVSQVTRCTRGDVRKVESATEPPTDPRLYRAAVCMAVLHGMDPIAMRWRMGLVRWGCEPELELDELRVLNPEWVDLVEEMNRMLTERPPRWGVEGDR